MTKARDLSKLLSTANGKIAGANLDVSFENISDTGTQGTKVASGTTGQRGSTAGQIRYNTDNNALEVRNNSTFVALESPLGLISVSPIGITPANNAVGGNQITLTGNNFKSGATVKFIGNDGTEFNATSVSFTNSSTLIATAPTLTEAKEPFDVKVINPSGNFAQLDNQIQINTSPVWQTASGTLATINDTATGTHATISATDIDGGDTITYSESTSVLSGAGLTLNSSTGVISGNPTNVDNNTTYTFGINASDGTDIVNRSFNIIVNKVLDGSSAARMVTSADSLVSLGITTAGMYYINNSGTAVPTWCEFQNSVGYMLVFSAKATTALSDDGTLFGYSKFTNAAGILELNFNSTSANPTNNLINCRSVLRTNRAFRYLRIKWKGSVSSNTYMNNPPIYDFGSSSSNLLSRTGVTVSRLAGTGRLPTSACGANGSYSEGTLYYNAGHSGGDRRVMMSNYAADGGNQNGFFQNYMQGNTSDGYGGNNIQTACSDEDISEIEIYIR